MVMRKQVKIIMTQSSNYCPRLSTSPPVRRRYHEVWSGAIFQIGKMSSSVGVTKQQQRKKKKKKIILKQMLSRFFQAQLLNRRLTKMMKPSPSKQHVSSKINTGKKKKMRSNLSSSDSLVVTKHGKEKMTESIDYKSTSVEIPEELLAEILKRLPVKYILRCRSVQKSWYHLIQTPMFITLHLNYQKFISTTHNHHPKYLFFHHQLSSELTIRFDYVQCQEYCKIQLLPGLPDTDYDWYGLSYGLICMSSILLKGPDYNPDIYLWNPLIQKYKTLPESPLPSYGSQYWQALAFGFVPEVNDYVVVHIVKPYLPPNSHSVIIGVYSLNTNSWKKFSKDNVFISRIGYYKDDDVVFVDGAAFWVGVNLLDNQKILMCFDTKTDVLCEIPLPDSVGEQLMEFC